MNLFFIDGFWKAKYLDGFAQVKSCVCTVSAVEPFFCAWASFSGWTGTSALGGELPSPCAANQLRVLYLFTKAFRHSDLCLTCKVEVKLCYKTHLHVHRDAEKDHGRRGRPNNSLPAHSQETSVPHILSWAKETKTFTFLFKFILSLS